MKKLIFCGLAGFILSCRSGHYEADSPMPVFNLLLSDSSTFRTDQIPKGHYTVIIYFKTDCSHCQRETADILKCSADLKTLNFVFLTPKPLKDLRQYAEFFKLNEYQNVKTATDNKLEFMRFYRPANVPYMVVFDKQKRLYRICEGPLPVDSLKAIAKI